MRAQELLLPFIGSKIKLLIYYWKQLFQKRGTKIVSPLRAAEDTTTSHSLAALKENNLLQSPGLENENDYLQKIDQFSILILFSTIFPLAPLVALANNFFEIRSDAYKYLFLYQRYPPSQAQDIGSWFNILRFLSILSISTNSVIVAFLSKSFEETYLTYFDRSSWLIVRLLVVISWHIIVHMLNFGLCYLIPDIPKLVQIARTRETMVEKYLLASGTGESVDDLSSLVEIHV